MFIQGRIHRMSLLTVSTGVDGTRKKEYDLGHGLYATIEVSDEFGGDAKISGILFHPEE